MKTLWFDVETTGLDPIKHDIVQVAGIIESEGKIIEEFEFFQQPKNRNDVDAYALKVQNKTLDDVMAYPENGNIYRKMIGIFNKHVNKFSIFDKFMPAGQNVQFDKQFLYSTWNKNGDSYLGSYLWGANIDLLTAVAIAIDMGKMDIPLNKKGAPGYKLEFIAKVLGVNLENAHSAIDDIKATRDCYLKIKGMLRA